MLYGYATGIIMLGELRGAKDMDFISHHNLHSS